MNNTKQSLPAMDKEAVIVLLREQIRKQDNMAAMVKRKRNLRDSEKAMTLGSIAQTKQALELAIGALEGRVAWCAYESEAYVIAKKFGSVTQTRKTPSGQFLVENF